VCELCDLRANIKDALGVGNEHDAYLNLQGAIHDIERQENHDKISVQTMKRVAKQISKVTRLLENTDVEL
jgi:hypothetical protein